MQRRRFLRIALVVPLAAPLLSLASCGGGGGSANPTPTPTPGGSPTPTPTPSPSPTPGGGTPGTPFVAANPQPYVGRPTSLRGYWIGNWDRHGTSVLAPGVVEEKKGRAYFEAIPDASAGTMRVALRLANSNSQRITFSGPYVGGVGAATLTADAATGTGSMTIQTDGSFTADVSTSSSGVPYRLQMTGHTSSTANLHIDYTATIAGLYTGTGVIDLVRFIEDAPAIPAIASPASHYTATVITGANSQTIVNPVALRGDGAALVWFSSNASEFTLPNGQKTNLGAFVKNGVVTELRNSQYVMTQPLGLNTNGGAVGYAYDLSQPNGSSYITVLAEFEPGGYVGVSRYNRLDLNHRPEAFASNGLVISGSSGLTHDQPAISSLSGATPLPADIGSLTSVIGINASGAVAGYNPSSATSERVLGSAHSYVVRDNDVFDLGELVGLPQTRANAIGDNGWIVGWSTDGTQYRPWLWNNYVLYPLGAASMTQAEPTVVSPGGLILGVDPNQGTFADPVGSPVAFTGNGTVRLTDRTTGMGLATLSTPIDANVSGAILVQATLGGHLVAAVLTPS